MDLLNYVWNEKRIEVGDKINRVWSELDVELLATWGLSAGRMHYDGLPVGWLTFGPFHLSAGRFHEWLPASITDGPP